MTQILTTNIILKSTWNSVSTKKRSRVAELIRSGFQKIQFCTYFLDWDGTQIYGLSLVHKNQWKFLLSIYEKFGKFNAKCKYTSRYIVLFQITPIKCGVPI